MKAVPLPIKIIAFHRSPMPIPMALFIRGASKRQLRLLKAVISTYSKLLHADKVITSQKQLMKNPFFRDWGLIATGRTYIRAYGLCPRVLQEAYPKG